MNKEFLVVTVAGTRFTLTQREAEFLSDRMRAALTLPHSPAAFTRLDSNVDQSIRVERIGTPLHAAPRTCTDC